MSLYFSLLGYSGAIAAYQGDEFGLGTGDALLNHMNCTGQESALIDCEHGYGGGNFSSSSQASVICAPNGKFFSIKLDTNLNAKHFFIALSHVHFRL